MAKLNVSPTRSNLMSLQDQLDTAQQGYELLEEKRQILVLELMSRLERARAVQREVDRHVGEARKALARALAHAGAARMQQESFGITQTHEVSVG